MSAGDPMFFRRKAAVEDDDALPVNLNRARTEAELGSDALLRACNRVFEAHAKRTGRPFADCRLLLANGVLP